MHYRLPVLILCLLLVCPMFSQSRKKQKEKKPDIEEYQKGITLRNTTNINTEVREFSPVRYLNGLVYVTQLKNGPIDEKTGETFYELFYAEVDPNGVPQKPQSFSVEVNSQFYEGPVTFNREGDLMYFTSSNQQKGLSRADGEGNIGLKIYQAKKGYFDWEEVTELPFNKDDYYCLHPTLSPDGKKLFFASNMKGGYGGMDLYFVTRQGDNWSKPINLGPEVNTNKNEVFPFIHESGTLFFSSRGHKGLGGLDLFMIDLSGRKWGKVINLGKPFNSEMDDMGFVLKSDGTQGYFSSDREGGLGKDDIYMFNAPDGIRGVETPELVSTRLIVYDAGTSRRVTEAAIRFFERSEDGLVNSEELYNLELLPSGERGQAEMVMKLVRKKDEELGAPRMLTNQAGEAVVQFEANKEYMILVSKPGLVTREVNFSTKEHDPTVPLEIVLSPSNCLALQGVVISDQYGQRIPNATVTVFNECDQSKEVLRSNIEGAFEHCLPIGCEFVISAEKEGFATGTSRISTVKLRGRRSVLAELRLVPADNTALKEPIRKGTVIVLENLYYDFNKSAIRAGEARELEALSKLMKRYPSMEIELGAHTDCRGTIPYNLKLSLRRAESAKQFLVQRGISANRIKAIGFGEAFPRNDCNCDNGRECPETEHEFNRRTEVKVIRIDEPIEIGYGKD